MYINVFTVVLAKKRLNFETDDMLHQDYVEARDPSDYNAQLPPLEAEAFERREVLKRAKLEQQLKVLPPIKLNNSELDKVVDTVSKNAARFVSKSLLLSGQLVFPILKLSTNKFLCGKFHSDPAERRFVLMTGDGASEEVIAGRVKDTNFTKKIEMSLEEIETLRSSCAEILGFLYQQTHGNLRTVSAEELISLAPPQITINPNAKLFGTTGILFLKVYVPPKAAKAVAFGSLVFREHNYVVKSGKSALFTCYAMNFEGFANLLNMGIPFVHLLMDKMVLSIEETAAAMLSVQLPLLYNLPQNSSGSTQNFEDELDAAMLAAAEGY